MAETDFEAALACALADTASPTGFEPVSGANQMQAEALVKYLHDLGWEFVPPRERKAKVRAA